MPKISKIIGFIVLAAAVTLMVIVFTIPEFRQAGRAFILDTSQTGQAGRAFVVQGGGTVTHGAYGLIDGSCRYAISKPITFYNSGNIAVTLDQITPPIGGKTLIISGENSENLGNLVRPQMFLTSEFSRNKLGLTARELPEQTTFVPSYQKLGEQIEAGEMLTFYSIILIDVVSDISDSGELSASVSFDAIFSNNQFLTIKESIQIDEDVLEKCG